ncbi:MAG: hypothetical protein OEZ43_19990 [Gammaproteobacteria bacterium]|nr:hypothetical protein [Gammaproteobacteria bacterium]
MANQADLISRRRLVKAMGLGLAAFISPIPTSFATQQSTQKLFSRKLPFVDKSGFGPRIDGPYVEEVFVALHREMPLPAMDETTPEYQNALRVLQEEFMNSGQAWHEEYRLSWSYQHYGVPDKSSVVQPLIEYCQSVQTYLNHTIRDIDELNMRWARLDINMDFDDVDGDYALVGKHTYFVLRVNAVDAKGHLLEPHLINAQAVNRAIHYVNSSVGDIFNPDQRLIYVIRGETSLISPFSELLHMITHTPAMKYAGELKEKLDSAQAKSIARFSGETVTEAAAVILARHFLHERGIDERDEELSRHANSLSRQLPEFQHSLDYMKKNGVQNALDEFSDNPKRFMKTLSSMG